MSLKHAACRTITTYAACVAFAAALAAVIGMGAASTTEKILRVETILVSLNPACMQDGLAQTAAPDQRMPFVSKV